MKSLFFLAMLWTLLALGAANASAADFICTGHTGGAMRETVRVYGVWVTNDYTRLALELTVANEDGLRSLLPSVALGRDPLGQGEYFNDTVKFSYDFNEKGQLVHPSVADGAQVELDCHLICAHP